MLEIILTLPLLLFYPGVICTTYMNTKMHRPLNLVCDSFRNMSVCFQGLHVSPVQFDSSWNPITMFPFLCLIIPMIPSQTESCLQPKGEICCEELWVCALTSPSFHTSLCALKGVRVMTYSPNYCPHSSSFFSLFRQRKSINTFSKIPQLPQHMFYRQLS